MTKANKAIEVFISYSHEDQDWLDKLERHLSQLKREGLISSWHDRKIQAGTEWAGEIDTHLRNAQIILLLVSSDFLASDYCYGVEVKKAIERHDAGEATVIPIILRACDWESAPFGKIQALPKDGKSIAMSANIDQALLEAVKVIREIIEQGFNNLTSGSKDKNGTDHAGTNHTSPKTSTDPFTPSNIITNYKHIKKNHSCEMLFTLSQKHSLKYTIEWHGVWGDKFTLTLNNKVMFDTGWQFLGIPDLKKNFEVENIGGSFFYHNKDNHFKVIITVGSTVIFTKDDSWNS